MQLGVVNSIGVAASSDNVDDDDGDDDVDGDDDDDDDDDDADAAAAAAVLWEPAQSKMHGHVMRGILSGCLYRESGRGHLRGQHFVRACAVGMHIDMSQEASLQGK